ncbi:MAG: S8 family peptidase [bacterium]
MGTWVVRTSTAAGAALALGAAVLVAPVAASGAEGTAAQPVLTGDYTDTQWNLLATSLEAVHAAGHTGKGVTIAILDSNFDGTHPEIAPNVVESFVVEGTKVKEVAPTDMNSTEAHGTHVAGIAAGVSDGTGMTGVAPEASLILGAVAWEESDPEVWPSVIAGLNHVAGRADVINVSLGQPQELMPTELRDELCAAVGNATEAGSVVVIAAGNSGTDGNPAMVPAGCATAVTVSALDPDLDLAYFSSFEGFVSVAAPGTDILGPLSRAAAVGTPFEVEPRPLVMMSGTSMAAPFVAGVAALVLEESPGLTPAEVRLRLTDTAEDRGPRGFDPDYGYGAVNPAAAVGEEALPAPAPTAFTSYMSFMPVVTEDDTYVSSRWAPPGAGGEIEGYTISILGYGGDDSWTVGPREVRDLRALDLDAGWIALTVHTSDGSFTTPYSPVSVSGGGDSVFAGMSARWIDGNRLRIFWELREPLPEGQVLTVEAMGRAPLGFEAMRRVTIDPRGRTSGSRTLDLAAQGHSPRVRAGLRQYAAGDLATVVACTGTFDCAFFEVPPKFPLSVALAPTGRRSGTLALWLNSVSVESCPLRAGVHNCEGVVARILMGGQNYVARFNAIGQSYLPVPRGPASAVNRVGVALPGLDVGGPFRLDVVTETDGSFG